MSRKVYILLSNSAIIILSDLWCVVW